MNFKKIIDSTPKKNLTIAVHEAGHALMAFLLGVPFEYVTLKSIGNKINGIKYPNLLKNKNPKTFCSNMERDLMISLAGYFAEVAGSSLFPNKINFPKIKIYKNGLMSWGSVSDMERCEIFLKGLGGSKGAVEILQSIGQNVRNLFSDYKNRMALLAFAYTLIAYRKISGKKAKVLFRKFLK